MALNNLQPIIEDFSKKISESSESIKVKTYWYQDDGIVKEIPVKELGREIPSITEVFDTIVSWGLSSQQRIMQYDSSMWF